MVALVAFITAVSSADAQQVFKTTSKSTIGYYEYLPPDYDKNSDKYPIVIFLHGIGERGTNTTNVSTLKSDITKVAKLGPPMYVKNGHDFPFILISPQLKKNYGTWPASYVMEVINHVKSHLRVDERRIYLTGLSLGGGGVWVTAQDNAEIFAAIAPVCGGYNSVSKAPNLAKENLPVWAFHGKKDDVVSYNVSSKMVNAINGNTPKPSPVAKLTLYSDVYHDAWKYAYKTDHSTHSPNIYDWMLSFKNRKNNGNEVPRANAGSDQTKTLSSSLKVTLSGTGSDADGSIKKYRWTKIAGPSATLTNPDSKKATISSLKKGTYVYRLTVTDNSGNTDSDYTRIIVK